MAKKNTLWRRILSVVFSLCVILTVLFCFSGKTQARNGIANNGLGNIWIDINANPYTTYANIPVWGKYAYGPEGCAWFASSRVRQLTGKGNTIYSGSAWYKYYYQSFGFSRGGSLRAPAIACWSSHVAIVEKIQGGTIYLSEGGNTGYSGNSYCVIRSVPLSYFSNSNVMGSFYGFVYLNGTSSTSETPTSIPNFTSVENATNITTSSARLTAHIPAQNISSCGVYVGTTTSNMTSRGQDVNPGTVQNMWYDVTGLQSGTTYYYKFYYRKNGQLKWSDVKSFTTQDVVSTYTVSRSNVRTIPDGDYYILSSNNQGYGLAIENDSKNNAANVHLWQHVDNHAPMIFHFTYDSNGYYKITNKNSGKCLDVTGAERRAGTNVQQYQDNGNAAQRWNVASAGNGSYFLVPGCATNRALDIYGGTIANGSNVQIWAQNGSSGQKFVLKPVDVPLTGLKLVQESRSEYQVKLKAVKEPANTTNQGKISWRSSDPSVASVDSNGLVQLEGGVGTAEITASCDGKTARARFTVNVNSRQITMYRLYNPNSGEHFYTKDVNERSHLIDIGWKNEGVGWIAPESGHAVYRLYNPNAGEHHYTMDTNEKNTLVRLGWRDEGVGWYSGGNTPVYREFNPHAYANGHNFTVNRNEHNHLVSLGWHDEGIGWYAQAAK